MFRTKAPGVVEPALTPPCKISASCARVAMLGLLERADATHYALHVVGGFEVAVCDPLLKI